MNIIIYTSDKIIILSESFKLQEIEDEVKSIFKKVEDDLKHLFKNDNVIKEDNPFNTPYTPNPYIKEYYEYKKDVNKINISDIDKPKNPMIYDTR